MGPLPSRKTHSGIAWFWMRVRPTAWKEVRGDGSSLSQESISCCISSWSPKRRCIFLQRTCVSFITRLWYQKSAPCGTPSSCVCNLMKSRTCSVFTKVCMRRRNWCPVWRLAMGDTNAVAFGQASHLGVLLQSEVFNLDDFITLHGRPPRQRWLAGLVIDDLVLLEARKRHERPQSSLCAEKIEAVRAQYERVGLPRHAGKAVFDETSGSFWGVQLDGKAGTLRPNMTRAIPLANIILQVLQLGHATVGLLEVIAGSLVAIFRCGGGSWVVWKRSMQHNKGEVGRLLSVFQLHCRMSCAWQWHCFLWPWSTCASSLLQGW